MTYRELARELAAAGFKQSWGKGSHLKWWHPRTRERVILKYNHPGRDAGEGAEAHVYSAIQRSKQ